MELHRNDLKSSFRLYYKRHGISHRSLAAMKTERNTMLLMENTVPSYFVCSKFNDLLTNSYK